jgi:hypothetical protein
MAEAQLTSAYEPLMDSYKVQLQRNGYSAACWVNSKDEIQDARQRLQAAIEKFELDQQKD